MNAKPLLAVLVLNLSGIILFLSWYLPAHHGVWFDIDKSVFFWFNHRLTSNRLLLWLIALTNLRAFDIISLLAMGLLYLTYWLRQTAEGRRRLIAIGFTMLLTAVILNQLGHLLPVKHVSPSLYFSHTMRVSELTGIPAKDASSNSFPGDHGMMLMIFASYMLRYFGKRAFIIAALIFVVFGMPRVMAGAHWFSDIAVGSLSVVLVGMSWVLLTSASDCIIGWLTDRLPGKGNVEA